MIISLIAALAENRIIGKDNDLPWRLPDDMKYFMETTQGHCVIMGRKNYESLPPKFRPLPNRTNIVVTRQTSYQAPDCIVVDSFEKALNIAKEKKEKEVFVIGGAEIYALALPTADRLYLTEIKAHIHGDTHFPEFDSKTFIETKRTHHPQDNKHNHSFDFVLYERNK